jgi:hypothetical protein
MSVGIQSQSAASRKARAANRINRCSPKQGRHMTHFGNGQTQSEVKPKGRFTGESVHTSSVFIRLAPCSQSPIGVIKLNHAFNIASRIENANLAGTKSSAGFRITNCLIFLNESGFNAG